MEKANNNEAHENDGYVAEPPEQKISSRESSSSSQNSFNEDDQYSDNQESLPTENTGQQPPYQYAGNQESLPIENTGQRQPNPDAGNQPGDNIGQQPPNQHYGSQVSIPMQFMGQQPPNQQYGSQQSIPMQNMGQQPPNQHYGSQQSIPMQYMAQQPPNQGQVQYVMAPGQYSYPANMPAQYVHPGFGPVSYGPVQNGQPGVLLPANQYIARDTTTPMPLDKEYDGPVVHPSIGMLIFKRIISALFIILDLFLNWAQFASWVGNIELPDWLNFLEVGSSLHGGSPVRAQCGDGGGSLTTFFGIITAFGTAFACFKLVNMVGETIIEYQKQNPSETEPRCRGFQIIHGWVETVIGMAIEDVPQFILLAVFSVKCSIDLIAMAKVIAWVLIKDLKNNIRKITCKHIYKPLCTDCFDGCGGSCCVYRFDFVCCCKVFFFRPCGCCGSDKCCELIDYNICPECTFSRGDKCFGEIEKDPQWALNSLLQLEKVFSICLTIIIVMAVLEQFNLKSKLL
ncbi:uncharacterized protein LOC123524880 [Mercenaria mercenaria]|uniref:uncharacterized protein LOC123524880 n=1 Tax=Mercenaria mercenaria TaxID=6596 RepID=UPI00234F2896|nr:uncharacterized protein LOC123524880 [Mercenaria mercenaria]